MHVQVPAFQYQGTGTQRFIVWAGAIIQGLPTDWCLLSAALLSLPSSALRHRSAAGPGAILGGLSELQRGRLVSSKLSGMCAGRSRPWMAVAQLLGARRAREDGSRT